METDTFTPDEKLADEFREWRGRAPMREVGQKLGVPHRTLEGVEQGRGFRYPDLLRIAMGVVVLDDEEAESVN
jgi:hypothetical protein